MTYTNKTAAAAILDDISADLVALKDDVSTKKDNNKGAYARAHLSQRCSFARLAGTDTQSRIPC